MDINLASGEGSFYLWPNDSADGVRVRRLIELIKLNLLVQILALILIVTTSDKDSDVDSDDHSPVMYPHRHPNLTRRDPPKVSQHPRGKLPSLFTRVPAWPGQQGRPAYQQPARHKQALLRASEGRGRYSPVRLESLVRGVYPATAAATHARGIDTRQVGGCPSALLALVNNNSWKLAGSTGAHNLAILGYLL